MPKMNEQHTYKGYNIIWNGKRWNIFHSRYGNQLMAYSKRIDSAKKKVDLYLPKVLK